MKITLAQIPVSLDINQNLSVIRDALDTARRDGSDILLTPEGSLSGYTPDFDGAALDAALDALTAEAAAAGVGLALGTCKFEGDGKCYNELRFYEKDGAYLGCHTKTLLCANMNDPTQGEISSYGIMPLRVFKFQGVTVGGLICNDMWANPGCTPMPDPHLTYLLARMGAKIIFHAVNGGRGASEFSQGLVKDFHECHILMKAKAQKVYIATVDNAYPLDIGVSSRGGLAGPDAKWAFTLPDTGLHVCTYEVEV